MSARFHAGRSRFEGQASLSGKVGFLSGSSVSELSLSALMDRVVGGANSPDDAKRKTEVSGSPRVGDDSLLGVVWDQSRGSGCAGTHPLRPRRCYAS